MSKKLLLFVALLTFSFSAINAQTVEEFKSQLAAKSAELAAIQGEVDALKKSIAEFPGWKTGAAATIGFNASSFSKWLGAANPNTRSNSFGISGGAFANLDQAGFFWRNTLNLVAAKTQLDVDTNDPTDEGWLTTADAINLVSLYGKKLNDKWAISAMGEYRSTFLSNFNNPGYLDIGAGATWTPIPNFVAVFHPLNYNLVFSDGDLNYESSLGCKIMADYSQSLPMGVAWKSNLSAFLSYGDASNLSNYTWINGFNFTAWKGIGVGFEFGLRGNRQEGYNTFLASNPTIDPEVVPIADFDTSSNGGENPLQSYWLLGLTYNISK